MTTEEFVKAMIANAEKENTEDDFYTQEEVEEKVREWMVKKSSLETNFLSSFEESFKSKPEEHKIELIEKDAFRLMQYYLSGRISFENFNIYLQILSSFHLKSEKELLDYIEPKAIYETYQYSMGTSKEAKILLDQRLSKIKNRVTLKK